MKGVLTLSTRSAGLLRRLVALIAATLREVFDESAYSRFLARNRLMSSRESYAAFRSENDQLKARRPRCC